jgi:hypothetical protein
LFWLTVRF